MSLTSKQIEELRAYAKDRKGELAKLINDAADTIEMLSAKLHASQMERSSQYYHGGWIPCQERLPEEHIGFYLVTVQKRRITTLNVIGCEDTVYDIDIARWDYDRRAPQRGYHWCKADKVIAWMPLPEPYREEGEK